MKEQLLSLLKNSSENQNFTDINSIYSLYEQLQYSVNISQMARDLYVWLEKKFHIENLNFELFDIQSSHKESIYKKGEEFYLDDEYSFFFIINTHSNLNAIVSFAATSQVHYDVIDAKREIIEGAFFLISPIIQNGVLKKNYVESSSIDSVTNVYNRTYFIEHVKKVISLSNKRSSKIYFLMIGIDHFKAVIDEFNYEIGDRVLMELAKVIHSNIKEFDMVARLTGDEFLVSLVNYDSDYEVINIAEKIVSDFKAIKVDVNIPGQFLKKTVCIGIDYLKKDSDDSIDQVIKNADIALYEAKNKGRSQVVQFNIQEASSIDLF